MKIKEIEPDICGECPLTDWCGPPYETPYFCRDGRFAEMEVEEYTKLAESSICGEEDDIAEDVLERWERSLVRKYRAKRCEDGRWVRGFLMRCPSTAQCQGASPWYIEVPSRHFGVGHYYKDNVDPETIGQSTGLCDMDGNEIYEGDIIRGKGKQTFFIEWSDEIAGYIARASTETTWMPCVNVGTMKLYRVVGNRWDNPELIGSKEGTE